ncbi:VOC family protein [Sphingomonas immobilis]|uniref:Lactoylglutathione lyase n=1 Tax=Sphingomonas immobilis TaxID=3063997 RepID=A0ABT9A1L1_9SPHN|nr:lactoylglutathione lyase [Sphingomonas sp. CA1-15]MDO7843716.1 lactoylglutathione lyase [Sphingomonas sp. CA1-15]
MAKMIFVNLPVKDVAAATAFYEAIGCVKDTRFSNDVASSMQWSDTIVFMLLGHAFYNSFTPKQIADTATTSEAILCLSQDSREEVDAINAKAIAAGGKQIHAPEENGFMYGGAFEDLDGHSFECMWMDMDAAAAAMGQGEVEPA